MFPIKTVQDYMYPQKLRGELAEQKERARLYGQQANWYGPKSQAEIDLINKGQIPHYLAMNDLIRSGQIPHYLAQNALMYQGQIPHLQAQSGLLGEQAQEQKLRNQFTSEQWKQWNTLQDQINNLREEENMRQQQPSVQQQRTDYSYPTNMPTLSEAQERRIDENLAKHVGTKGALTEQEVQNLMQAFTGQQAPKQMPQASAPNNAQRIADLKAQQQSLFGNIGKLGVETPLSKEERAERLAEKREDIKVYSQSLKSANESSKDASQMKNLINQFQSAYNKTGSKGPVLGRLPAVTSEQQIADNAAQNMQQMMVKLMKTNRMTNYELQFAGNLKLNRAMNPQTVKDVGNFLKAKTERLTEEPKFINAAKNKGISAEDAKVLWNEYENDRPVYNFETRSVNKNNLNSYGDYLTPEALNKINNPSMQPNTQAPEMVQVIAPNGQVGNIPRDRLDEALKRGARLSQ